MEVQLMQKVMSKGEEGLGREVEMEMQGDSSRVVPQSGVVEISARICFEEVMIL